MRFEELFNKMLRSFFVITTGIVASMFIFCLALNPKAYFSIYDIGRILLMAFVSDLTFVLFYSRKELGKRLMLIRQAIHLPVLLAVLFYFARLWDWVSMDSTKEVIVFIALIIVVYVLVLVAGAYQDQKLADKLNSRLKQRYHS